MTPRLFFTIITLLLSCLTGVQAQNTAPQLAVKLEAEINAAPIIRKLNKLPSDTNQVNLLIKASHIYWDQRNTDSLALGSCLSLAGKAYGLSSSLQYNSGKCEAAFMMCKVYMLNNEEKKAADLLNMVYGEEKVRLLLVMAEQYTLGPPSRPGRLSMAFSLIEQARSLSIRIGSDRCLVECQIASGKYYLSKGEITLAKRNLLENIHIQHQAKNNAVEARFWSVMAHYIPDNEDSFEFIIHCHEMAIKSYLLAGAKKDAAIELKDLAVVNTNHNRIELAGKQFRQVISIFDSLHEMVPRRVYYLYGEYYRFIAQYHLALRYALKALQTPEFHDERRMMVYRSLGETYAVLGEPRIALKYYQTLLDYQLAQKSDIAYVSAYRMAHIKADAGQAINALSFLTRYIRSHPPQNLSQRQLFTSAYGDLYRLTGNYDKAEAHYKEMLALNSAVRLENGRSLHGHEITIEGSGALYLMGRFCAERKRYPEAKKYLENSLIKPQFFDTEQEVDTYKLLFKADSAQGHYLIAIKNFERHKLMYDSINSVSRNNQISELNIRFQTEQKEKDIKILESKQRAQQAELLRAATIRKVILGGAAAFLLLAVMAFSALRIKQRSNRKLHAQQMEINHQNRKLQTLLSEKEVFLKEKDWLLKEVHHRVKNNLQIVMSLLSTQSFYMQNDLAKEAILQSENRVQSIALIHQKLYTSDNLASISMPAYISDLVIHLAESFDTGTRKITFHQEIEQISIDLSQAVPIGLILNEAITNAIKYAFSGAGGVISVMLRRTEGHGIEISISDNGKGLPGDFDLRSADSLGMEMMRGLSMQLKGILEVSNASGTAILIRFPLAPALTVGRSV